MSLHKKKTLITHYIILIETLKWFLCSFICYVKLVNCIYLLLAVLEVLNKNVAYLRSIFKERYMNTLESIFPRVSMTIFSII